MLKLYFSKGSTALAPHILLEEVGASYEAIEVSIPEKQHLAPDFLKINPKGRVPVLETADGVITENPAILEYIARTHGNAELVPKGAFAQAEARSLAAYICATMHVAFAHRQRGARWASNAASLQDMQDAVPGNIRDCATFLEGHLALSPWAFGARYSFCDPYLLIASRWLDAVDVPIDAYPKLAAHRAAMIERPATQAAMAAHGLA